MGTRGEETVVKLVRRVAVLAALVSAANAPARAQDTAAVRLADDSVTIRLVDTDLRAAIQALGRYLPKPVVTSNVPGERITLETPGPVPVAEVLSLLRGLVESRGLVLTDADTYYRIGLPTTVEGHQVQGGSPAGGEEGVRLFVIRLKHAKAPDVAATVNLLFGGGGEFSGRGLSTGLLSDELRRDRMPPVGATRPLPPAAGAGIVSALAGQVTVVPDGLTNSLLIRATPEDFAVIKEVVEQVDVRPLQVLIEVLIVEARHDKRFFLGIDYKLPPQSVAGGTGEATLNGGLGLGDLILRFMSISKADIDATLRLAASKGDVSIISRPVLLASNGTEARFMVGSQRPFVQVQRSLPTETANRDQVVQYKDVGTELTVLPTINQDGYVSLLVQQQINEATEETQFDAPIISTREARTQVLVRDGQTIVIGGLRDEQRSNVRQGIPVLSTIPILGGLFGSVRRGRQQTEIYIFITPRIIKTDEDADKLTVPRIPEGVTP
jgi:general secretion pathway protein D